MASTATLTTFFVNLQMLHFVPHCNSLLKLSSSEPLHQANRQFPFSSSSLCATGRHVYRHPCSKDHTVLCRTCIAQPGWYHADYRISPSHPAVADSRTTRFSCACNMLTMASMHKVRLATALTAPQVGAQANSQQQCERIAHTHFFASWP